jgi:hypothetical protein
LSLPGSQAHTARTCCGSQPGGGARRGQGRLRTEQRPTCGGTQFSGRTTGRDGYTSWPSAHLVALAGKRVDGAPAGQVLSPTRVIVRDLLCNALVHMPVDGMACRTQRQARRGVHECERGLGEREGQDGAGEHTYASRQWDSIFVTYPPRRAPFSGSSWMVGPQPYVRFFFYCTHSPLS